MEPIFIAVSLQKTNTVPLWSLLLSGLAAPVVSVVVAFVTLRAGNQREAIRLQGERQTEDRRERLRVYRTLAQAARKIGTTEKIDPDTPEGRADVNAAIAEISLLTCSGDVLEAAYKLGEEVFRIRRVTCQAHNAGSNPAEEDAVRIAKRQLQSVRSHFVDLARSELGLAPIKEDLLLNAEHGWYGELYEHENGPDSDLNKRDKYDDDEDFVQR